MPSEPPAIQTTLIVTLQRLLPVKLFQLSQADLSPAILDRILGHLRSLQHSLQHYVPRRVAEAPPAPGQLRHTWHEGALMYTDVAGFTSLIEAHFAAGLEDGGALPAVLNNYFAEMVEIISKSGGSLIEFTGDALLAEFPAARRTNETAQAVRAGLRMQRAMSRFVDLETPVGKVTLQMRVGIHAGRYLTADIGTPHRMDHILLGAAVHCAKQAESAGRVGCVCLTLAAAERASGAFDLTAGEPGHVFVVDQMPAGKLGDYDLAPASRRFAGSLVLDRSTAGLRAEIEAAVGMIEPLACYLPGPVLRLLVESAAQRKITARLVEPAVMFVNLSGLPQAADAAASELPRLVAGLSDLFSQINTAVEARGGVLKKVTCQEAGLEMVIYFGAPADVAEASTQAAEAALAVQRAVANFPAVMIDGRPVKAAAQVGLARGPAFSAEIGEARGRREYNVLGHAVNTAAHLMNSAAPGQILITESVYAEIAGRFACTASEPLALKGQASPTPVYCLSITL